jgi:tetratricopeptide (TPR) repeat protein
VATLEKISNLIRERHLDQAASALARLVKKKGAANVDWRAAAGLANSLGDQSLALAALQRWCDQDPGDPQRQVAVINALGTVARHREAARRAHKLQSNRRAGAEGYFLEGCFLARFGKIREALALQREALELAPNHVYAWEQIALLQGYENLDADLEAMNRLLASLNNPALEVPLRYALGRAYDYAQDYDVAFQQVEAGAALRDRLSPFALRPQIDYYQRLRSTFTPALFESLGNKTGGSGATFILSAPRSGSTLVEQLLSMAAGVTATGEHTLMRLASLPLASMEPPDMLRASQFSQRDWKQMSQTYMAAVRLRFDVRGAFTDKSMLNHNYAGLVRLLFPEAKLIWLKRDLRDVAWSCFRSRINANQWAQKMADCVGFLRAHDALCEHWRQMFGEDMLVLSYEDLVCSPDTATQRVFDHVGAVRPGNWDEFYRSSNPVATASLAQVRQPLVPSAVGSWRRYESQLAPIYERLSLDSKA